MIRFILSLGIIATAMLDSIQPCSASDPIRDARLARIEHQLISDQQLHESLSELLTLGYAAPAELFAVQQRIELLERTRVHLFNDVALSVLPLNEASPSVRVLLPGFANYLYAADFGVILIDRPSLSSSESISPIVLNNEPARNALQAELALYAELRGKLQTIDDGSLASANEIGQTMTQEERVQLTLAAIESKQVVASQDESPMVQSSEGVTAEHRKRLPLAIAELTSQIEGLNNSLKRNEEAQRWHQTRYGALLSLPQDEMTQREVEDERLQMQRSAALVADVSVQIERATAQREYLRFISDDRQPFDRAAAMEIITRMIAIEANNRTSENLAQANIEIAQRRSEALDSLYADGYATWLETERASVNWLQAKGAKEGAVHRRDVAAAVLKLLKQEDTKLPSLRVVTDSLQSP
ncbi:MAG: hypothetical protein R3C01_12620 [Planctomycetaceae bacterium]